MGKNSTSISRLWQIRRVIKAYGLAELVGELDLPKGTAIPARILFGKIKPREQPIAVRLRLALEELGPIFIKLGQALSTRPDLLEAEMAEELAKLQDQVPPFPETQALNIIKDALGSSFDEAFTHIETKALASASVAQVHTAQLKQGNAIIGKNNKECHDVVIKVLRPGIVEAVERDLSVMYFIARFLNKHWSQSAQFRPLEVINEYENTIRGELDLRREAANCSQMAANFSDNDIIYVPTVYWDYTSVNVMVMERIYGTSVRDIKQLKSLGYDLKQLASDGVETFFKQAFEDNFFHADMHPGNIFVSEQGRWIAIDFGIMGVLSDSDKQYLAEMLLGFFNRDYRSIAESHQRAGWIPEETNLAEFEAAVRMVCEPNFAKPISEISFGLVLVELFRTIRRFNMPVQPQLVLLYKTLLNVEGLGRQLYPQLNLWDTAKPFLENWMKQQLSPQAWIEELKSDWPRWQKVLKEFPDYLEQKHKQPLLEQQRHAAMLVQMAADARKKRSSTFHLLFGFTTTIAAAIIFVCEQNGILGTSWLAQYSPLIGSAGLLWAYFKSR